MPSKKTGITDSRKGRKGATYTSQYTGKKVSTTSTFGPAWQAAHQALGKEITKRFPMAERVFEYALEGWRVPRPRRVEQWKGTIDPNYLWVFLAERKQGLAIHFWNPYGPHVLQRFEAELTTAGYKVMRACVNWNRKALPELEPLGKMLDEVAAAMRKERGATGRG